MKHHAHSQRGRRRGPRIRTERELASQQRRIERRRGRLAAGPVEVVVQLPGPTLGRRTGGPWPPGRGFVSRWVRQSATRIARERAEAEEALRRG